MFQEFKNFAMKGNVVDLAIGVIIGAAFGKIVAALIDDIIMPIIGLAGSVNFNNHFIALSSKVTAEDLESARKQGNVLAYGDFITIVINFLIVAIALFLVIKGINSMQKQKLPPAPAAPAPPSDEVKLLTQIRDALVKA